MAVPLVSVCCITYNQEAYVRDAIEGFLMQKTDFPIEIIIHDDASTDSTQNIIKEYANKHENIVPILRNENIKSTGIPIFPITFERAKGKYVALCEGDDYWTDPLKLHKQVDFLENNQGFSGCFTNYRMVDKDGKTVLEAARGEDHVSYYDRLMILEKGLPQTCTVMYKNIPSVFKKLKTLKNVVNGDQVYSAYMAQEGKIKFIDEVTASRRIGSGMFSTLQRKKQLNTVISTFTYLKNHFRKPDEQERLDKRINELYISQILNSLKSAKFKEALNYNKERKKRTDLPIDNKLQRLLDYIWGGAKFRIQRVVSKWKQG